MIVSGSATEVAPAGIVTVAGTRHAIGVVRGDVDRQVAAQCGRDVSGGIDNTGPDRDIGRHNGRYARRIGSVERIAVAGLPRSSSAWRCTPAAACWTISVAATIPRPWQA